MVPGNASLYCSAYGIVLDFSSCVLIRRIERIVSDREDAFLRRRTFMQSIAMRWSVLIAVLALLASCGGSGDSTPAACTNTTNMELYTSASKTMLMTSITVTAAPSTVVPDVPIYAAYQNPPVEVILGGYPYGGVHPATYGIFLIDAGSINDNPFPFNVSFDTNRSPGTYHAALRFVATDVARSGPMDCQDVQVTFTIN